MANITIDPDILIQAMTAAIQAAVVQQTQPVKQADVKPSGEIKKKRGRPKKVATAENVEIITADKDSLKVLDEPEELPKAKKQPPYIMAAKSENINLNKVVGRLEPVTINRGEMKFIDINNVPHEKKETLQWEPTERRNPAKKMTFTCSVCNCTWEDYPSNVPQAFWKERDPSGYGETKASLKCENCHAK